MSSELFDSTGWPPDSASADQLQLLREYQCHEAQAHLFRKPISAEEVTGGLAASTKPLWRARATSARHNYSGYFLNSA
jgi:hypothetical protein